MSRRRIAPLIVVFALGCGRDAVFSGLSSPNSNDAGALGDGGPLRDSGPRDAGPARDAGRRDAGPLQDAGVRDAGVRDGGTIRDAGVRDGGTIRDGGQRCEDTDCGFLDGPCVVGVCDNATNQCRARPRPNGTACDDGNACTVGDFCRRGLCESGGPRACPPPPNMCVVSVCRPAAGGCVVEAAPDGTSCDDGQACSFDDECHGGMCVGTSNAPPGDMCPGISVPIQVGAQVFVGDNTCAADDAAGTCGFNGGRDIVHELVLAHARRLRAETLGPAGGGYDTVMYLRSTCAAPASELVCDDDSAGGLFSRIDERLAAGTYYLYVDGATSSALGFHALRVEIDPQNRCAGASPIAIPPLGVTVRFDGATIGATNDFQAPCAFQQNSPDHVYTFTVPSEMRLRFETEAIGGSYDTAMALHAGPCTEGMPTTIACDDDLGQGTLSRIETTLGAGTYFLTVDGFGGNSQGPYRLAVTRLPNLTAVVFPDASDARLTQMGTTFSRDGDFVEGVRNVPLTSVSRAEIDLTIVNNLTCGAHQTFVMINGQTIGTLNIGPGQTLINQTFMFPTISGPLFSLRLETANDIPGPCGSIDYPNGVSNIRLGN